MIITASRFTKIVQIHFKANIFNERWLPHTKHEYGYDFPVSKYLKLDNWLNQDSRGDHNHSTKSTTLLQQLKLFHTTPTNDRAIEIIEFLLACFSARLFTSDHFFMVELDGYANLIPPEWASYFDKMKGIIREPGRLIVQIPSKETTLSIPAWHNSDHPYFRFIYAIYVCRQSSLQIDEDVFSDILGESEKKIARDLHAILIAALGILSIAGGVGLLEKLVLAVLRVKVDPKKIASADEVCNNWQIRNRRYCPCHAKDVHRPLSPVAAAKASGIDIWRIRQSELVTRVWDLEQDIGI